MSAYTDEIRAKHAAFQLRQTMGATFYQFRAASLGGPPQTLFYHLPPEEREPICDEAEAVAVREGWIVPTTKPHKSP